MNATALSAAASVRPASHPLTATQPMSNRNVACMYTPIPANSPIFQDHFIAPSLENQRHNVTQDRPS
jgi:hypothetical protein